tara:strand:- start:819 stop:1112 length:294 start_codon:yes stop_codon:yes gene_type:complete
MAQSLEEIKASFDPPTHKVEDGVRIELTAEEVDAMLDEWSANVRNQQLDQETNGWLYSRLKEYPSIEDCIHALLDGGDTLTDLQAARQAVKDKYPKG